MDFALFNGRLDFTGDIYYKKTKDMLIATEIPKYTGYNAPEVNAGDMNTRGWEAKISWSDNIGKGLDLWRRIQYLQFQVEDGQPRR